MINRNYCWQRWPRLTVNTTTRTWLDQLLAIECNSTQQPSTWGCGSSTTTPTFSPWSEFKISCCFIVANLYHSLENIVMAPRTLLGISSKLWTSESDHPRQRQITTSTVAENLITVMKDCIDSIHHWNTHHHCKSGQKNIVLTRIIYTNNKTFCKHTSTSLLLGWCSDCHRITQKHTKWFSQMELNELTKFTDG